MPASWCYTLNLPYLAYSVHVTHPMTDNSESNNTLTREQFALGARYVSQLLHPPIRFYDAHLLEESILARGATDEKSFNLVCFGLVANELLTASGGKGESLTVLRFATAESQQKGMISDEQIASNWRAWQVQS